MLADGIPAGFLMSFHFVEPYPENYCVKSFVLSSLPETLFSYTWPNSWQLYYLFIEDIPKIPSAFLNHFLKTHI